MCGTPSQEEEALRAIEGDARAATGAGGKTIRKRDGCHQGRRGGSTAAGGPRRRKPRASHRAGSLRRPGPLRLPHGIWAGGASAIKHERSFL
jgi:hypothetical protein